MQPIERETRHGLPPVFVLPGLSGDMRDGRRFARSSFPWGAESARPPSAIGSEIEFQIATGVGMDEEELGGIELPQVRSEDAGPGIGVHTCRSITRRAEVKVIRVGREAERGR